MAGLSPLAAAAAAALCAGGIYFAGPLGVESSFGGGGSSTGAETEICCVTISIKPYLSLFALVFYVPVNNVSV